MKRPWKSKTLIGLMAIIATSAPGLADPVWNVVLTAGVPAQWVAIMKLVSYIGGAVAVAYGRAVASGPLSVRS